MKPAKPKLLIVVLCGTERNGWLNPWLVQNLLTMQRDSRWDVDVQMLRDISGHDTARNTAVVMARESGAEYLWMLDNDNCFGSRLSPMDLLTDAASRKLDAWAMPYLRFEGKNGLQPTVRGDVYGVTPDGKWADIGAVSTGTLCINRRVWESIPGPWFKFEHDDTELHSITLAESFFFCQLARKNGFKVWACNQGAEHYRTAELSNLRGMVEQMMKRSAAVK
jgi:hypothetical protein